MADILTQMQDHLDILLGMMTKGLVDIRTLAPPAVPPGQQRLDSFAELEARTAAENTQSTGNPSQPSQAAPADAPIAFTPEEFQQKIKDTASDIALRASAIELLIASLPGLNSSEKDQVARMKELERELEELEGERLRAVGEKEALVKMVEEKIMGVGKAQ